MHRGNLSNSQISPHMSNAVTAATHSGARSLGVPFAPSPKGSGRPGRYVRSTSKASSLWSVSETATARAVVCGGRERTVSRSLQKRCSPPHPPLPAAHPTWPAPTPSDFQRRQTAVPGHYRAPLSRKIRQPRIAARSTVSTVSARSESGRDDDRSGKTQ